MKTLTAPGQAGVQRPHAGVQAQDKKYPWCLQRTCPPVCHHFMRQWEDQRQIPQQQAFLEMPRRRNYKKRWQQHSKLCRKFNLVSTPTYIGCLLNELPNKDPPDSQLASPL